MYCMYYVKSILYSKDVSLCLYSNRVLQMNNGIEFGLGNVQWEMAGALFGGWFLVYLIVWRGLHQSGYIIWFTALFPYTVMSVLLVRALTLPGAVDGLKAYIDVSHDPLDSPKLRW